MTYSDELYVFNADTLRFCWFNQHVIDTLGYSRQELSGMHVTDIFPEIDADSLAQLMAISPIEQQYEVSFETRQNGNGYQLGRVMLHMELYSDQGNCYVHARAEDLHFRNEHQQQQARLVAMGEMIGNIAHQWRQPLNALAIILLNLEDALVHGETDAPYFRQALARSQEILSDMSRTIDDFRGFLKNDKLLAETVLAEVINNSLRLVEATMANHQIKLVFTNPHSLIKGIVNSGELTQALLCLITNAKDQIIDRNIQNGEIRISIEPLADCSEIRVVDNAGGIAESNLDKIFDPYFTTKPGGIGLGLYISNLTIKKTMNGHIGVKNCNEGAQFSIFLPNIAVQEHLL